MRRSLIAATIAAVLTAVGAAGASAAEPSLWQLYDQSLKGARYVDLTHTITPSIPVWAGFGPSQFAPSINPATGNPYTYKADGFEATRYTLATDQLGTQLDPPAHWAPEYASIDELPATFAVRPLVVISIVPQVRKDFNYSLKVSDIRAWEIKHGTIPPGSVVFVRSDWSKRWPSPQLPKLKRFPGVSLAALKFLHLQRHILFHGHEPLDTDSSPDAGRRVVADAPRLRAGRGRGQPRSGPLHGLSRRHRLPEVRRWRGRLRALRGHLPAELAPRTAHRPDARGAPAQVLEPPALGRAGGHARALATD